MMCRSLALIFVFFFVFFFKQKTADEMRISDWSSDVCSSDLCRRPDRPEDPANTRVPSGNRTKISSEYEGLPISLDNGNKMGTCGVRTAYRCNSTSRSEERRVGKE